MKKYCFIFFFNIILLVASMGQGDVTSVANSTIVVGNGATIYVEGSIQLEDNSLIENEGDIKLTHHWKNNSTTNGFNTTLLNGNVHLIGGNQHIKGTNETHFYNLHLYGDYSVKECFINSEIDGRLYLYNSELQTHDNLVRVNNPNSNAVSFDKGYVASDLLGGYLIRKTNSNSNYFFPVGNSLIDFYRRLRPVTITPLNNSENYYAVRLAPLSPNNEIGNSITNALAPYPTTLKQAELSGFNTLFYHNIARVTGSTPANIDIWYEEEDGDFNTVAHWRNEEQWIDEEFTIEHFSSPTVSNFPLYKASVANYDNFTHDAYLLSSIYKIEALYIPNTFTPNGDGNNETFNPINSFETIQQYELTIFDRWGKEVFYSDNSTEGWDGLHQNKEVPTGTYIWLLKLKPDQNNANYIEKMGHIILLR